MLRPARVRGDEGQVDLRGPCRRKLRLRLLCRLAQPLNGEFVLLQVDRLLLLELTAQVVEQNDVEVLAAQQCVAVGRLHLEDTTRDLEYRDIKRAAAQVVDGDHLPVLLVQSIRQRRGGGLVDDPEHLEARDLAGVLGRLPLRVVEVGGHSDDGVSDWSAEVRLGRLFHLPQNERTRLRRGVLLPLRLHPRVAAITPHDLVRAALHVLLHVRIIEAAADESFGREDCVLRVSHRLPLGGGADKARAVVDEGDDRGRGSLPLGVLDHLCRPCLHHGDARVGCPQVYPYHVADGGRAQPRGRARPGRAAQPRGGERAASCGVS
mmetsp:Transcript_7804/g.19260  ORF Transcript_7804/g.19260 Transcript_7804/m.19260 type:complete len:321 (-) Transcript_7804:66-1028(-)